MSSFWVSCYGTFAASRTQAVALTHQGSGMQLVGAQRRYQGMENRCTMCIHVFVTIAIAGK